MPAIFIGGKRRTQRSNRRRPVFVAALVLSASFVASAADNDVRIASLEGRNLVIVVVDSLRADHLGCYGYDRPTSDFIDSLAGEGLVFENVTANSSYLTQSLSVLFTGRLPTSAGTIGMDEAHPLDTTRTLPQLFQRAGYRTGIVSNQPLVEGRGFSKGFEDVQKSTFQDSWTGAEVSRRALDFVDGIGDERFMLYVHIAEPHQPYAPPEEFLDKFPARGDGEPLDLRAFCQSYAEVAPELTASGDHRVRNLMRMYDAEIAFTDRCIEGLVGGLKELGVADNTVVLITSVHGEEFLEHGYAGHAWTLYEEVLRVPLILWSPGIGNGARISAPVSHVDVLPTLIEIFNLSTRRTDFEGESFFVSQSETLEFREPVKPRIAELVIPDRCVVRSVTKGGWKYISMQEWVEPAARHAVAHAYLEAVTDDGGAKPEPGPVWSEAVDEELYYLPDDPYEDNDLASRQQERLVEFRAVLQKYRDHCAAQGLTPRERVLKAPIFEMEQTEELESLGYL